VRSGRAFLVAAAVLAGLRAQAVDDHDSSRRCAELAVLQDRGALTVDRAVAALADADENVARTAAAIVRHEWIELPAAFLAAVDDHPAAARTLLREFATGPRPAALAWANDRARALPGRTLDDRLLALAARGTPPTLAEAELLFDALAQDELGEGYACLLHTLPPERADALVGRLHRSLVQGRFPAARAWTLCERFSNKGVQALLATAATLPVEVTAGLLAHLAQRTPELVHERVAAALDGGEPLAPWVAWLGPVLDRPARIERVAALVADAKTPPLVRREAAIVLLSTPAVPAAVLDLASSDAEVRRRALDVAIDKIAPESLLAWLDEGPSQRKAVVRALARRSSLAGAIEQVLVGDLEAAGHCDGDHGYATAMALAERGSVAALQRLLPLLRRSGAFGDCIDRLGHRREPFVREVLLTELTTTDRDVEPDRRQAQLDAVALALASLGDRRELERLVQHAPAAEPAFVRRCAHHVRPLPVKHALRLLDVVAGRSGDTAAVPAAVRSELLGWAATAAADEAVRTALVDFWRAPVADDDGELQDVVVRALVDTPFRDTLVAEVRAALAAGPLPEALQGLPFDLLGSMPSPPGVADLELCADLALRLPRTDPERERSNFRRWPDGGHGWPLVQAVGRALQKAEPAAAGATFAAAVTQALADPDHTHIARARLAVLWRELGPTPAVQQAVAVPTATLWLQLPAHPGSEATAGAAFLFLARGAIARGAFAEAATHAEAARAAFLRLPAQRRHARVFLGERDPTAGLDPWAALAALPHWCRWRDSTARGDMTAAGEHARLVREFAGHDRSLLSDLPTPAPESSR
jgi:hypothetical protein